MYQHDNTTPQTQRSPRPPLTCINHPGRETAGEIDGIGVCHECVEFELRRHHLWLRSFALVRGGVEGLRP